MSCRNFSYLVALMLVSAPVAIAQNTVAPDAGSSSFTQQPAPIERNAPSQQADGEYAPVRPAGPNRRANRPRIHTSQPAHGVTVRTEGTLQTVSSDAQRVELKLDQGVANVMVNNPAEDQLILIDLPGGQTQLLKNGFYTFNASTNTVRVFSGEADAFAGTRDKPTHLKGDDQAVFSGGESKVSYSDPYYSRQDVLPGANDRRNNDGYGEPRDNGPGESMPPPAYGYAAGPYSYYGAPYGYGYADPYYAWDSPYYGWGYGYPYFGYGYGIGLGWGGWGYGGYHGYGGYGYGSHGYGGVGRGGGGPIHPGGYSGGGHTSGGGFHGGGSSGGHR